jgi:hypothetical protein
MISSLKTADGSCGAYIGAVAGRQAIRRIADNHPRIVADRQANAVDAQNYSDFTKVNDPIS